MNYINETQSLIEKHVQIEKTPFLKDLKKREKERYIKSLMLEIDKLLKKFKQNSKPDDESLNAYKFLLNNNMNCIGSYFTSKRFGLSKKQMEILDKGLVEQKLLRISRYSQKAKKLLKNSSYGTEENISSFKNKIDLKKIELNELNISDEDKQDLRFLFNQKECQRYGEQLLSIS